MSPSFIGGGCHDSAGSKPTDYNRLADQARIAPPFDLNEERIHIDVQKALGVSVHSFHRSAAGTSTCHTRPMPIHLIRHGEVSNPHGLVYADIPGFILSAKGRRQATAAGEYLAADPPRMIVCSPLDRAVETSERIARITGSDVVADPRLTEWAVTVRWRGAAWADLPTVYPGELEAYLDDPRTIEFSPESINELADRFAEAVTEWSARTNGDIAFVSHEDPIHAAYLRLVDLSPVRFHENKPGHCTVLTLQPGESAWHTAARWDPPQ